MRQETFGRGCELAGCEYENVALHGLALGEHKLADKVEIGTFGQEFHLCKLNGCRALQVLVHRYGEAERQCYNSSGIDFGKRLHCIAYHIVVEGADTGFIEQFLNLGLRTG